MTGTSAWKQYKLLVAQGVKAEFAERERLISPVLFAITMLLVFSFAVGDIDPLLVQRLYIASVFLTAMLALQLGFSRLFEPDRQDRVFDLLRTYPVSHTAWFLAKYTLVLLTGAATLLPTLAAGAFFHQGGKKTLLTFEVAGIGLLALAGLAALGVLLSAITLKANARQILYPLLYFPLTAPVLLAAVQASLMSLEGGPAASSLRSWLGLLGVFDVIYITLGILLYTELVDDA